MFNPVPQSTNYIFKYNRTVKEVQGYKMAYTELDDIRNLEIANLEKNKDVRTGWIKLSNEKNDEVLNQANEAKWVLRFPKGDPVINDAWKILVVLVENGALWDIKASAKSDEFPEQVICVYVVNEKDIFEIVSVYTILLQHNLISMHLDQAVNNGCINYISDESTRHRNSKPTFTNKDISDLSRLLELKDTVSDKMFAVRWNDFVNAFLSKIEGRPLDENFRSTYYCDDEAEQRQTLLMAINEYQVKHSISNTPVLNDIMTRIRSTLTSNYKFTSAELLEYGTELLKEHQPKQSFLGLIKRNPDSKQFQDAILFFNQLVVRETARLSDDSSNSKTETIESWYYIESGHL